MLLSKVHLATVTDSDLNYDGSLTIPPEVVEAAGYQPYEQIMVADVSSGTRWWTYVMVGTEPGRFCLNGAAARLGEIGDRIIVFTFAWMDDAEAKGFKPRIVRMDEGNRIKKIEGPSR
jgi:aspartate 1-decarboxylase